jgi:uncharacterized protein (TIGR04255 family)
VVRPDIPDFEAPPLIEVAIGIQLLPLTPLRSWELAELAAAFRPHGYSLTEEHVPLPPMPDEGAESQSLSPFLLGLGDVPLVPRLWLTNGPKDVLIQLQRDRFIQNWRQVSPEQPYPRYESLRESFITNYQLLDGQLNSKYGSRLTPVQCEVNYINAIDSTDLWPTEGRLDRVVTSWQPRYSSDFLTRPLDVRLTESHDMHTADGSAHGRLYISAEPAKRIGDRSTAFVLSLTARGRCGSPDLEGVLGFCNAARIWIVTAFDAITTPEAHQVWRKK